MVDDDLLNDPSAGSTTIQTAVDAASGGDEVLMHLGTYVSIGKQIVDMLGKSVPIRSVAGSRTDTLRNNAASLCFSNT